jgi:hypothetical protein
VDVEGERQDPRMFRSMFMYIPRKAPCDFCLGEFKKVIDGATLSNR